jgi:hypothetical protein
VRLADELVQTVRPNALSQRGGSAPPGRRTMLFWKQVRHENSPYVLVWEKK